jgi:hypothetical protein
VSRTKAATLAWGRRLPHWQSSPKASAHLCLTAVSGSPANYDGEFLSLMAEAKKHMRAAQDIIDQMVTNVQHPFIRGR